jgi:type VI secretion system protein ImpE
VPSSASPEELIAAGEPADALKRLQERVRDKPQDAKLRTFLFQLLCVLGQWDRAQAQLELCGQLDHGTLAMVNTYREALKCEVVREAVFAGKTTPMLFGQPQTWVASLVEALQADARGDVDLAAKLRSDALAAAPATAGTLDKTPFDWIADADSRLGPVLEAVVNGRYVWVPFAARAGPPRPGVGAGPSHPRERRRDGRAAAFPLCRLGRRRRRRAAVVAPDRMDRDRPRAIPRPRPTHPDHE